MIEKEFIPYYLAIDLKELGFDDEVIATYPKNRVEIKLNNVKVTQTTKAILFQQTFRWFREKHNYHVIIDFNQSKNNKWYYGIIQIDHNISISPDVEFETYEEAELAALKELIKTIKDRT